MKKHTYQERLIAGLLALGFTQQKIQPSKKYTKFTRDNPGAGFTILHVGKMGALRCGPSASASYSVGDPGSPNNKYYQRVLAAGDAALSPPPSPSPSPAPADTGADVGTGSGSPES